MKNYALDRCKWIKYIYEAVNRFEENRHCYVMGRRAERNESSIHNDNTLLCVIYAAASATIKLAWTAICVDKK